MEVPAETTPEVKADAPAETAPETPKVETPVEEKETEKEQKELIKLTKQLKDTRDAFTQERQVNKGLQAKMQTLESSIGLTA